MIHVRRILGRPVLWAFVLLLWSSLAEAQAGLGQLDRGPRFLQPAATTGAPAIVDVTRVALLRRRVSLNRGRATVRQLLQEITRQSGLQFAYNADMLPVDRVVGLRADSITIAAALTEILVDAGVDVLLKSPRQAVLLRRGAVPQPGIVAGRITDGKTGEAVSGVDVFLEGTRYRASSGEKGYYKLPDVEAGSYTLTARRVGYAKQSRLVVIVAGQELTADVSLQPVVTHLNELVTTVTGEQRARELGHVVGRINADSVVKEAPVSSLSQLLNARVPGLQVFTNSGVVGGRVTMRIRSANSVALGAAPIIIVDGIRYTADEFKGAGIYDVEPTSRLNDINPNDVESVEVVKGPSAATLYGTDAANGVVVITTKRGRVGKPRWNAYVRSGITEIPSIRYPDMYWGWGTVFGSPSDPYSNCTLAYIALGYCTQRDSVMVTESPLNDAERSLFGARPQWQYGINASGGRETLRYYVSGDLDQAIGPIRMPPRSRDALRDATGVSELRDEQSKPNSATKANVRANLNAALGATIDATISTGYTRSGTRTLKELGSYANVTSFYPSYDSYQPDVEFSRSSIEKLDRFFSNAAGQWRPAGGWQARASIGFDLSMTDHNILQRRGDPNPIDPGLVVDERARRLGITSDLGLTSTIRRGGLSFRTAAGAQYTRSLSDQLSNLGINLPPGGQSIAQAASKYIYQSFAETATLGSYLEETIGVNDRLYLTGALRVDGASAFGRDYSAAIYPKASASWILSDESFLPRTTAIDELRLRYAFGVSGQQPLSRMTLPTYSVGQSYLDGVLNNRIVLSSVGNPRLRPERVQEHEFGMDYSGFDSRVRFGLTWSHRRTVDPIIIQNLPVGFGAIYTNLGLITGHAFEAEVTVRPIESRAVTWQVTFNHALSRSKVMDLGGQMAPTGGRYGGSYEKGYPLGARFAPVITDFADANGDGIIGPDEITVSPEVYRGESTAPVTQTLVTNVGLLNQRVRLSAMFERRSGYTQLDYGLFNQCAYGRCRAAVDPTTSFADQAAATALLYLNYYPFESGSFVRLREVGVAWDLPVGALRAVGIRSGSLALTARNLGYWSSFSGPDPESASVSGAAGDVAGNIPQSRSYTLRFDVGL